MTLQMIMAHGAAQATFDRHLPIWERLGCDIKVFCPQDDLVQCIHPVIAYGQASHSGESAMERFYHMLRWMEGAEKYDMFLVQEYDSFSLEMPEFRHFTANWFEAPQAGWKAERFAHPPLALTRDMLSELIASIGLIPFHAERGMWDRVCGLAVPKNKVIPFTNGFSRNTIEPEHITHLYMAMVTGLKHFHGVKTQQVLEAIIGK